MTNSHLQLLQIIRMILTRSQTKEKLMNKNLVHTNSFCVSHSLLIWHNAEHLQMNWHFPMYGFFKTKVVIGFNAGCKYHFFKCTAQKCRGKGQKGVCHYQDSKDHANPKSHVIKCFGCDAVDAAFANTQSGGHNGSIFAVFAWQGQQPVKVSHCAHTSKESRCALYLYFIAFCHEIIGFILQGGVQKATVLPRLSRIANLTSLWKLGILEHPSPAQWLFHVTSKPLLRNAASILIISWRYIFCLIIDC